ncbi:hypothetical protein JHV675_53860 [Mycobacterium avium subsp. hominissuis]
MGRSPDERGQLRVDQGLVDRFGGLSDPLTGMSNDQNLWMSLGGAREKWAHLPEDDLKVQ